MEKTSKMEIAIKANDKKEFDEITALVKKTDKENPKPEDVKALQIAFQDTKGKVLAHFVGNLQNQIFLNILDQTAKHSVFLKESTKEYIEEMKAELGYQHSTFIEMMLIDEIILRWLRLQNVESQHNHYTSGEHTLTSGIYWDKRLDSAQKRYLRSVETLAKVRKMIANTQAKGAKMIKNLLKK